MPLKADISRDLVKAMKAHDESRVGVLRLLLAAVHTRAIEKRAKLGSDELSDEEIGDVFRSEAKKRREAAEIFAKANREDLAERERSELKVIQGYLPAEMDPSKVNNEVKRILGSGEHKDFGSAMKAVMAELKGKADAKIIGDAVKSIIKS